MPNPPIATLLPGEAAQIKQLKKQCFVSSARNHYQGEIQQLIFDDEIVRLILVLGEGLSLQALLTRTSATRMQLQPGKEIHALFKAASVQILLDPWLELKASNQWWGEVIAIHAGQHSEEITLQTASGHQVTALMDAGFCQKHRLQVGMAACAVFSASTVILLSWIWNEEGERHES